MQLNPREEILRLWRAVVRHSFHDGSFVWATPGDALTDAQQLLCILHPATNLPSLKLDVPNETADDAREALRPLGDSTSIPVRLVHALNEYMVRHADADGQPRFTVDPARFRLNPDGPQPAEPPESVESYATGLRLSLAATGFAKVLRSVVAQQEARDVADELAERASIRLTAAMVGLLRSFAVRIVGHDEPVGAELRRILGQPERAASAVEAEFLSQLVLERAALFEVTIGSLPDARFEQPSQLFDLGFAWAVLAGAPMVEIYGDAPRQREGTAHPVPHLPSTMAVLHAAEELWSQRTRILTLLSDEHQRLARALQLRYELTTSYWSTLATFGDHRWPLERLPWRTLDGDASDLYSICIADIIAAELSRSRGSDIGFSHLVRVYADTGRRAGIIRPPYAGQRPRKASSGGLELPIASAADGPYPAAAYRVAGVEPTLLLGLVRAAGFTESPQLLNSFEDLVDLTWQHLTSRPDGASDVAANPLAAFSHDDRPNWSDIAVVTGALTLAVSLADGVSAQAAAPLNFVHNLLIDTESMVASVAGRTDPELDGIDVRLDRARQLAQHQPARAAALLYQIIATLDPVLDTAAE
ncbi:SCO2524 family protein [Luedemannella helvata]|uniref:SCO2524 family protein n=1 Tax=Luedemannella helvata TaxID=349315 RepID=A0ABP4WT66_9ACTN